MRLITRADLDGLACAAILQRHEPIDGMLLTHPQEILDGNVEINGDDIIANLPPDPRAARCFCPERGDILGGRGGKNGDGIGQAECAAQLVWRHYGEDPSFAELVEAAARLGAARLATGDVLAPDGYILFGYTLDARTGLGAYQSYFRSCIDWVATLSIDELLRQADVRERVRRMRQAEAGFKRALASFTVMRHNVIVTDFRQLRPPPIGNRFLVYCLFPQGNVSLRLHWGHDRRRLVAAVGHSIFNRTNNVDLGELMARFGGGGHERAAGAPLAIENAEAKIDEIITALQEEGRAAVGAA